mmetsp:Transcript_25488/g.58792  ORF Transcript_25488/g.58792 Transcript_25488/m.58792 type:complete len:319 (+) Transcript_25488:123-1079(+)
MDRVLRNSPKHMELRGFMRATLSFPRIRMWTLFMSQLSIQAIEITLYYASELESTCWWRNPWLSTKNRQGGWLTLQKKNVFFLMEAMWTRFFPAVRRAQELLSLGAIGTVRTVHSDFGLKYPPETQRIWDLKLGGGALLDIGVYPVAAASWAFGGRAPVKVACVGTRGPTKVDTSAAISLQYEEGVASISVSGLVTTPGETTIVGTNGSIRIHGPSHCPTKITLTIAGKTPQDSEFPLPATLPGQKFNFPHSQGLAYEAIAVQQCLAKGYLECPEAPLLESVEVMKILDAARAELDVVYPCEQDVGFMRRAESFVQAL